MDLLARVPLFLRFGRLSPIVAASLLWALQAASGGATVFTVTTTADAGPNSLRDALTQAQNCAGSPHTIAFNVPSVSLTAGVAVITPLTPLPAITCATTVDGTTQTTNVGNTNNVTLGTGGTVGTGADGRPGTGDELPLSQLNGPEVEIVGSSLTGAILTVQAGNVTVKGLSLHGGGDFSGVGTGSGNIDIQSGTVIAITGNVIGASAASYTAPAGSAQTQNNLVRIVGGSNINIANNLMGFARWRSVLILSSTVSAVSIQANEIKGSFDGIDCGNTGSGPGGFLFVSRNFIHDAVDNGSGSNVFGVFVTQTSGSSVVGDNTINNMGFGVSVDVSRPLAIATNIISNGAGNGVRVFKGGASVQPATIELNSIFGNVLGIDLAIGSAGVTPNDGAKLATLPNLGMDYPIFTAASVAGGTLTIAGYVGNNPAGSATFANSLIEVYKADNVPANQDGEIIAGDLLSVPHGEGRTFLGSFVTDGLGKFSTTLPVPAGVTLANGDAVTATANDQAGAGAMAPGTLGRGVRPAGGVPLFGNTSEFGPNAVLPFPPPPSTPTSTATSTATSTPTGTPTNTATSTPSGTPTNTATSTPTVTQTPTSTATAVAPAAVVPTLSFPLLALLALALAATGWLLSRK